MKKVAEKIKILLEKRNMTKKELCRRIDVTETGFAKMLQNNTLRIDVLEQIAKELDADITYFISDDKEKNDTNDWQKEKENLLKQIDYLTSALRLATLGKHNSVHYSLSEVAAIFFCVVAMY